jgi:hypothetical protein
VLVALLEAVLSTAQIVVHLIGNGQ